MGRDRLNKEGNKAVQAVREKIQKKFFNDNLEVETNWAIFFN